MNITLVAANGTEQAKGAVVGGNVQQGIKPCPVTKPLSFGKCWSYLDIHLFPFIRPLSSRQLTLSMSVNHLYRDAIYL
jgi:hypothetical protein